MAASVEKPRVNLEFEESNEDQDVPEDSGSEGGGSDEELDEDGTGDERSEAEGDDSIVSDEEEGDDDGGEEDQGDGNPNAGWADVMAKILQKETPNSKPVILQKNKQLEKIKEKAKQEMLERKKQIDKRKAWEMLCRVKPDVVKDREGERALQRTATRGVVQLFNAVRTHQKVVDEKVKEAGASERKKAKILSTVSKKDFINVLRGTEGKGEPGKTIKTEEDEESQAKPAWSVLQDDYMMGASMKDWDKESEDEQGDAGDSYNSESD